MGVNNRQRRAAKRRKRGSGRAGGDSRHGGNGGDSRHGGSGWAGSPGPGGAGAGAAPGWHSRAWDESLTATAVLMDAVAAIDGDRTAARAFAERFGGPSSPLSRRAVAAAVETLLTHMIQAVAHGGWTPADLGEIVRRRLSVQHLPLLAALLATETDRHPRDRVAAAWREEVAGLGPGQRADAATVDGLELALGLSSVLSGLPQITTLIPPPGAAVSVAGPVSGGDSRVLSRVRALLAKAESTQFPEEAEALSAKAQELISRYALDRLVAEAGQPHGGKPVNARRLWIDPPYVFAKALLVGEVADANRCRTVVDERLGFTTVVGEAGDLDAVELLVTSLLVQANTAMLACGRQSRGGMSRTTSFRRSFLVAYATRIGERLRSATADATEQTGRAGELVPVLRRQAERVEAARDEMFPHLVSKHASITNAHGWAAGRAAADFARLDTAPEVTEAAS